MAAPYTREQQIAELAVLRASILTKQVQSTVNGITKDDDTPVTIADFAAQALLIKTIRHFYPNDAFLGEEDSSPLRANEALCSNVYELISSSADVADPETPEVPLPKPASVYEVMDLIDIGGRGNGGDSGRFWVMDPVDGTAAFLRGQQYAVSLALIEDGKEVVGILGCPNISAEMTQVSEENIDEEGVGVMLTAVSGQGATIRTMSTTGLGDAMPLDMLRPPSSNKLRIVDCAACQICRHDVVAKLADILEAPFPSTEIWSSHIRYAALILGGDDMLLWVPAQPTSKIYIWDHAGTHLIFTELGGKVTDLDGKDVDFGAGRHLGRNKGLVAARGGIHKSILKAVNRILDEVK